MEYRKRIIQVTGVSAAAGFAVMASPATASASTMHTQSVKQTITVSTGSHIQLLESKYGASNDDRGKDNNRDKDRGKNNDRGDKDKDRGGKDKDRGKDDCKDKENGLKKLIKVVKVEKPKVEQKVVVVKQETPKVVVVKKEAPKVEQAKIIKIEQTPQVQTVVLPAPPPPVQAVPIVQTVPVQVQGAQLAKTGAETVPLAALGTALLGLGIAMERAGRRKRKGAMKAIDVKDAGIKAESLASQGQKLEGDDKNKLIVPVVDVIGNTAAWPTMIGA